MKLPLTPEEQAWLSKQDAPRKGTAAHDRGKQCKDCAHLVENRINNDVLCGRSRPNVKTKPTNTCNSFRKR
jgi:hypothetical protein